MIKTKNLGEYVVEMQINGTQSATPGNSGTTCSFVVPFNARLKAVFGRLTTAGITNPQTTDLLWSTGGNAPITLLSSGTMLSYASTKQVPTYGVANLLTNPPLFSQGDILQLSNTAVSGTPAVDQCVLITLERQRAGEWNDAVQTDTVGSDSDQI